MDWFERLTGFKEVGYDDTCKTACKTFQIPGVNSGQKFPPWLMR